ncbi:response regulator transcription factor [soil metagenome]
MLETPDTESIQTIAVLIVEDHALTRIGLKTALKRTEDIQVIGEAADGEEAVAQAEKLQPNVILMDVGMPVMDGIQAAKIIIPKNPNIRIIMLTQHDNDRDILASLAAGASGYCLKDVAPERLYTAIRSVNAGDTWLDASIASRVLKHYSQPLGTPQPRLEEKFEVVAEKPAAMRPAVSSNKSTELSEFLERPLPDALSPRELEVLKLIVDGLSNQEIADKLTISLATAKTHVRNILNKLAVDDRTQAAVHAMRRGLV